MSAGTRITFRTKLPCRFCQLRGYVEPIFHFRWVFYLPGGGGVVPAPGSPTIRWCRRCDGPLDRQVPS